MHTSLKSRTEWMGHSEGMKRVETGTFPYLALNLVPEVSLTLSAFLKERCFVQ